MWFHSSDEFTIQLFVFLYNCNAYSEFIMADREQKFLKAFGKRLAELRKRQGLSQEELADRAGLHAVAITYIETGKRLPKLNTVYKLATGLNVKVEILFKGL